MPEYTFPLRNGKTLVLKGDTQPSDEVVESIAAKQGVQLLPKGEKVSMPEQKPELGERVARAIEGPGVSGSIRAFSAGAAKGAIEQIQHPFTWGGPQTQKLIRENVPYGNVVGEVLNTASPGGMVLTKAGQAIAPALAKAPIVAKVAQFSAQHPRVSGAVKGGAAGGAYEALTGGDIRKGVVGGAMLGAGFKGKIPGVNIRIGGEAAEAAGAEAAAGKAASKGAEKAVESSLIKTPEEFAKMDQARKIAAMKASQQGLINATGGSASERALLRQGVMGEGGKVTPEALISGGLIGAGAAGVGSQLYGYLKRKMEEAKAGAQSLNPFQRFADVTGGSK